MRVPSRDAAAGDSGPEQVLSPALSGSLASFLRRSQALLLRVEDNTKAEFHNLQRSMDFVKFFSMLRRITSVPVLP
jgi:hypothetical protein